LSRDGYVTVIIQLGYPRRHPPATAAFIFRINEA
jgi:hypothetical protein